ncbi:hypothetical protein ONS95_002328 [Cadophora gregata]|uniref:uncharacterized protein n=1 Tax=Cadophora gregata TaxID=51156 RepID=UPI0026DD7146|nr:uncharacterized protein ONS95_002328 [Cadophora gregata]KAK0109647.1 hypothetical protein ONS95_002328 [Cadophora gregata]
MATLQQIQSSDTKPQRKSRAGTPKVRTGCLTCKERRVKCDETKPACLRCLKFWGRCEGYAVPRYRPRRPKDAPRPIADPTSRPLLPLLKDSPGTQSYLDPSDFQPLHRSIATQSFKSPDHYQSYAHFLENTSNSLPGFFKSDLWKCLLPQASYDTLFICSALIAIGALSGCGRKFQEDKFATSGMVITPRYRFALSQYGTAVSQMRENLVAGEKGLNHALIACLLVVCFECIQGNYFSALTHSVSGHKIFKDWLNSKNKQLITESSSSGPMHQPKGHFNIVVEDELVAVFSRMDLQIMSYIDPRPASIHMEMKNEGEESVQNMPDRFTDIHESRVYLELVQRRTSHFIASTAGMYPAPENGSSTRTTRIATGTETGTVTVRPESETLLPSSAPPALRIEYSGYVSELLRWFKAFTPLFESLVEGSRDWVAAAVLQIEAQTHQVMLLSSFSYPLDYFTPTYRSVVDLAEKISDDPLFAQRDLYMFDMGIVNPLRLVAKWCREPTIRRKCIMLLRKTKCKEGLWDALCMAAVTEWQMEIEEEYMDENGIIPEEARCRTVDLKVDNWKRSLVVKLARLGTGEIRSTVIEW